MKPLVPAGSSPACLNCAATYSAARLWPALPVLRPSIESSARTLTWVHHLSLALGAPPPSAKDLALERRLSRSDIAKGTPPPGAEDLALERRLSRSDIAKGTPPPG